MYGIRLGTQEDAELPISYPIYCYQLTSERTREQKRNLLGPKSLDDAFLHKELNGLPLIIENLESASKSEFGCLIAKS